jgi:formate hydrogenlyase subunit 3/multisubunit Na+/H+ antiporter MnhD subunit
LLLSLLLSCVAAFLGVAVLGILASRHRPTTPVLYAATLLISAAAAAAALTQLVGGGAEPETILPLGLPWIGARFRLDGLAALFVAVINLGGTAASLYAIGYGRHEQSPQRVLPFFPAFLAGMNLVLLADDAFSFLLSWELMSVASWALVISHHSDEANRRAGYVYLVMASFGTLALLLAFGLLAGADGSYTFSAIRATAHAPTTAALVLFLVLLGAGSKAGLVPLHVWLPLAHPAAPSHVSALMSGVMTKVAIYGFIRIVFDLLHASSWWSSLMILLLGGITAVLGVLHAIMETDLKRLLAYSTIENIGIIFIGLGLAMAFRANHMDSAAALAMTAALFHVINHSWFKSILFFGAGAVISAAGTGNLERLGGLIHRMPVTAFAFLVASFAISALPPLNGFVSEWLTFQAVLLSPVLPQWGLKIAIPAVGGLLALAAALAAACFVRAFGVAFLGRPRSPEAEQAPEVDRWSLASMLALTILCVLAGLFPGLVIDGIRGAVAAVVGQHMPEQSSVPWLSIIPIGESRSSYNGLLVFVFATVSALSAALLIHQFASRAVRRSAPWGCGYPELDERMQYSAASFAQPIRRVFGSILFRTRDVVDILPPGDPRPARLEVSVRDLVWDWFYAPIANGVGQVADRLNRLQFLTIRKYLGLVFGALVILLMGLALWS